MGLAKNVPVFLSEGYYNKAQVDYINIIVRTIRRAFESRAKQKQKPKPSITHLTFGKYNRVLNLRDYLYNNIFAVSFILNPQGFVDGQSYSLFETSKTIKDFKIEGSNSDDVPAATLSNLGKISLSKNKMSTLISFIPTNMANWPIDSNGNLVSYSVYFSGEIYE